MKISEIINVARTPVATDRFRSTFEEISKSIPGVIDDLKKFIEFRKTASPAEHYGKKDYMLSNGDLRGYWHWHLVFGKHVVIYQMTSDQLQLIAIVSHKILDGPPPVSFTRWLVGLTPDMFTPFEIHDGEGENSLVITDDEKQDIIKLFWESAVTPSDREYLEDTIKGKWDDTLMEYLLYMVKQPLNDNDKWTAIINGFNGEEGLIKQIESILKDTRLGENRKARRSS